MTLSKAAYQANNVIKTSKVSNISVIIPVYNGGESFRRCLTSLSKAASSALEIIVVSDGDTDNSWLLAKNFGATVIRNVANLGPAKARNIGAQKARGDIIFFIDADVEIYPDTIDKVAIAFQEEPDLVALIGSYDDEPGSKNFLSQYKNLFHHYTHQTATVEASTFWGACGAIRRDIFLKMDGFDENYLKPCVEDIELGYRLKKNGYRIKLCKHIQVKHLKQWQVISLLKAEFFYRALPWTALILRDRHMINDLNLKLNNRISVVITYLLIINLFTSLWWNYALIITCSSALALLIINIHVYKFFLQKRGFSFTIQAVIWHWIYYFYSGLGFAIGFIRHQIFHKSKLSLRKLKKLALGIR
ncbi:glycosyl transferase family 2 [Nostoc sp. NIES-3756]|uniref:glycosyltransferase n=1 Tax=Nostoc sp. NIES-3756 TaxID=1751286 RepID=UPI0007202A34|nr:glycosyltransferase [Nostoc sp. NIES-3756]BAT55529.1 glycosyl transferase family 2 [Nostoc sp. NIES-3756]